MVMWSTDVSKYTTPDENTEFVIYLFASPSIAGN
jgi:hypothetical protein